MGREKIKSFVPFLMKGHRDRGEVSLQERAVEEILKNPINGAKYHQNSQGGYNQQVRLPKNSNRLEEDI